MKGWLSFQRSQPVADDVSSLSSEPLPTGVVAISDEEFLRRFVVDRDDRAFAELVGRHGGMVMGVCRRVLGATHDAEDAFQAVFIVLARKANTLRRAGSLPAWLHQTAFRTALRARGVRGRRREIASEELDMIAAETWGEIASEHGQSVVDEELNALPERYRVPLFLCCIEGKTLESAARQLGWSVGSLKGRLERGRAELRRRLLLRKVPFALGVVALAALAPATQASAAQASAALVSSTAVAPSLVASTVQASMQVAAGRSALGYVSHNALHLAKGSWNAMPIAAVKFAVSFVAVAGIAAVGVGRLPAPGGAGAAQQEGIHLNASFTAPADQDLSTFLALADEPRREGSAPREGAREGSVPRDGAARDGVRPQTGPRDGEGAKTGPRDGEGGRPAVREGSTKEGAAREGAPREGAVREGSTKEGTIREGAVREGSTKESAGEGERANPLSGFKPQTQREEVLYRMIMELQREMAQLRQALQVREGGTRREGDGERPAAGQRDGERPATGARDGERPANSPRDGERPAAGQRDGERPATGARDGERPANSPRDGERPAPRKEGE